MKGEISCLLSSQEQEEYNLLVKHLELRYIKNPFDWFFVPNSSLIWWYVQNKCCLAIASVGRQWHDIKFLFLWSIGAYNFFVHKYLFVNSSIKMSLLWAVGSSLWQIRWRTLAMIAHWQELGLEDQCNNPKLRDQIKHRKYPKDFVRIWDC